MAFSVEIFKCLTELRNQLYLLRISDLQRYIKSKKPIKCFFSKRDPLAEFSIKQG
jgi:hypothetical protein